MAFNSEQFDEHIKAADASLGSGAREMALDNIKQDMVQMTPDERVKAAEMLQKNNERGGTQITLVGDVQGGNFKVHAEGEDNMVGKTLKFFGLNDKAESQ